MTTHRYLPVTAIRRSTGAENVDDSNIVVPHILVVDDDPDIDENLERLFSKDGYRVTFVRSGEQAQQILESEDIDAVITAVALAGELDGVELTRLIAQRWADIPVIVTAGYAEIQTAVEVLKIGASDYLVKPLSAAAIQESTRAVLQRATPFAGVRKLHRYLKDSYDFGGILSKTPEMLKVFETIRMVAPTNSTVVVHGETGTGKELVASAIHHLSARRKSPFVIVNCGCLAEALLESELFGNENEAARSDQAAMGKIRLAHGGTLFLDEVENLPPALQTKLLLVLENQRVQQPDGNRWIDVDIRIVAASSIPLKELVAQSKVRNDFYYRINVISMHLLPLRERTDDIPLLIQNFLRHHSLALQKKITGISPAALDHLKQYSWPGNVRELQNVMEKAVLLTQSHILNVADLQLERASSTTNTATNGPTSSLDLPLKQWIRQQEKAYLTYKLKRFGGRIDLTAKSSHVDARTIHRKMQMYGLNKKVFNKSGISRQFRKSVHSKLTKE